jgi:hypothetical protein
MWHLQKCSQYILVKFIPSIILLYPLSLIFRIALTGLIFPFLYEYIVFHPNHSPTPFLYLFPLLLDHPPERNYFAFLSSIFEKKKFLFK